MAKIASTIELAHRLHEQSTSARRLIAIAGPPGSGKSTLAEQLVDALNNLKPDNAAVLPMDGYHYDDRVLRRLGSLDRKGAPDTFDVEGLRHMLARLRENSDPAIAVPVFDRDIEIARAGAALIAQSCNIVVVEGNYLLLDQPPWNSLAQFIDTTVMINTDTSVLRKRLTRRWQILGLDAADVDRKLDESDIPNGRLVMENSVQPDLVFKT